MNFLKCSGCSNFRVNDLLHRVKQLDDWSTDFILPCPLWISGLFNPMSFLTAVMQVSLVA